jgi:hypothetical protein
LCHPFPAVTAAACEFEKMSLDFKASLTGQPLLEIAEVAIFEINHSAAVRANQVMVVF